jgi:hypothetical protein
MSVSVTQLRECDHGCTIPYAWLINDQVLRTPTSAAFLNCRKTTRQQSENKVSPM